MSLGLQTPTATREDGGVRTTVCVSSLGVNSGSSAFHIYIHITILACT